MRRMGKFLMCKRREKWRQHECVGEGAGVCKTLTIMWDNCSHRDSGTIKNKSTLLLLLTLYLYR